MSSHKDIQNQYLNIRIANTSIVPFTEAIYTKNNTNPILYQPYLYKLSVDRFQIPVDTIPLIIAESTGTLDELVYQFQMTDDDWVTTETQNVIYKSSGLSANNSRYYYIYSYSRFIRFLNTALETLYSTLGGTLSVPPHFEFDPISQKLSLVAPPEFDSIAGTWKIRFNFPLLRFFSGFELKQVVQGVTYEFEIYNRYNNIVDIETNPVGPVITPYFSMLPDVNTLTRWNELNSIVINTNLPVNAQYIEGSDQNAATSSEPILTDFIVLYPDNNSYASTTVDFSIDERDLYDLYGSSPIRNVLLQIYWTNYKGQRFPLYLSQNTAANIKLLFKVRDDIK